ncbi:hypothetical protein [Bifidobacterium sp.]|uniref:hypothetical protein n=1 Tax=Bifidobacterium sp. TaxID=41200 RepID=UPI0039EAEAF2
MISDQPSASSSSPEYSDGVVGSMYGGVGDHVHGDLKEIEGYVRVADLVTAVQSLARTLSNAEHQIAVTLPEAARMMGMKDTALVRELCESGELRFRHPRGRKTFFVSVQSIREYMNDITIEKPRKTRSKTR